MRTLGIITLTGYFNYGNRLQNYALTRTFEKLGFQVYTIWNKNFMSRVKDQIKIRLVWNPRYKRYRKFYKFSRTYMKEVHIHSKRTLFDHIVIGSDQVWNPKYINENPYLLYEPLSNENVIVYAASLGIEQLPEEWKTIFRNRLSRYNYISVREITGKNILSQELGLRNIELVPDPTLLLSRNEWNEIKRKPDAMKEHSKYILNYFLGDLSTEESNVINEYARVSGCEIIDILNEKNKMFDSDPAEFISLIENAFLICTDSFHACVFSFIYDRPFIVFKRKGCSDYMYSRINNLLTIFDLRNREFEGKEITIKNLNHDYKNSYLILEQEKRKGISFIKKSVISNP